MSAYSGNWFHDWFNSPYYHLLYRNRDQHEARGLILRLMDRLELPRGSRILDLACGRGRHAMEMFGLGHEVVGIDLSEESIAEASAFATDGLDFFVHDMRELYWTEHFDAVFNLFTSFGYFHSKEDDQRTINSVYDALRPEGVFILDFLNVPYVVDNMVAHEEKTVDGVRFLIDREVKKNLIEKRIHVVNGDIEHHFTEQVDALTLDDFESYFAVAGFEVETVFGNYSLDPYDGQKSERLIMSVRKPLS